MLVRAHGFAIDRGAALHVEVELDLRAGLPGLAVIGLGGGPARDLRERVQAAVLNSGFGFPRRRLTVNVAPAPRRSGAELDLAVACCVLAANGTLERSRLERIGLCGELGLGGELRACGSGAGVADAAARAGLDGLVLGVGDREAAEATSAVPVVGARTLVEVATMLRDGHRSREQEPEGGFRRAVPRHAVADARPP
jgi:magnesium chelatase family protein